jgi:hypothetical protein
MKKIDMYFMFGMGIVILIPLLLLNAHYLNIPRGQLSLQHFKNEFPYLSAKKIISISQLIIDDPICWTCIIPH